MKRFLILIVVVLVGCGDAEEITTEEITTEEITTEEVLTKNINEPIVKRPSVDEIKPTD